MSDEKKKLSYEELENVAKSLSDQNQYLKNQVAQLIKKNQELVYIVENKRLDYLFKVVENQKLFNSDFVVTAVDEIVDSLTPTKEEQKDE